MYWESHRKYLKKKSQLEMIAKELDEKKDALKNLAAVKDEIQNSLSARIMELSNNE